MKKIILLIVLLFYIVSVDTDAQPLPAVPAHLYGIKDPGKDPTQICTECKRLMSDRPSEIGMGFALDPDNVLYFVFTDEQYFDKLFTQANDGIAVDILRRDQFPCTNANKQNHSWLYNGYLGKPLFLADIKANKQVLNNGRVLLKIMTLPKAFQNKEVEFNLILLKNRNLCWYNRFFNLESHHWGLLEMGMYTDTLTEEALSEKADFLGKRLKVQVPFAKDKYEYGAKDIKPLYDSLSLGKYEIKSIVVRAYSSVEGTTERNMELQKKRAESIINSMRTLQSLNIDSIKTEIVAGENWVEFYEDIIGSKFKDFSSLSKDEIKQKLNSDRALCNSMEPILRNHRKAVIFLELEPKRKYKDNNPEELKSFFDQSIADKNISEAMELQKEIFRRVYYTQLPDSYLDKLEVPERSEYNLINNSTAAYKYQRHLYDLFETLRHLKKLQDLLPNDHHVHYNICALQLLGWVSSEITVDPEQLKADIEKMNQMPIDKRLVKRMLMNYHILHSSFLMEKRQYMEKDKSLRFIHDNYVFLRLSDLDVLSLVQYFVEFGHSDWAKKIILPYVKKIDASEDMLFYYLNLTIAFKHETESSEYRGIMLNAINKNQQRFCNLFSSDREKGGISFQLLNNEYLKKTYCEICNN